MNDFKFNPKLVVITGVTQGLGEAMLKEFYERGFIVLGCGRNSKKLLELSQQYSNCEFSSVDISLCSSVQSWVKNSIQKFGVPKFIINNASIIDESKQSFELTDINDLIKVIRVNLFGAMYVTHAFLPSLKQHPKQTTIINMSSGWGRNPEAGFAGYCTSKFGLEGFTGTIAKENKDIVTVVSLDPREGIATNMLAKCTDQRYYESRPSAEEWAKIAVPYILTISPKQSGKQLTVPEIRVHQR